MRYDAPLLLVRYFPNDSSILADHWKIRALKYHIDKWMHDQAPKYALRQLLIGAYTDINCLRCFPVSKGRVRFHQTFF